MVRALVGEIRCCRGESALVGSDKRESVAGLYRLSSRMRGLRASLASMGSDEAAGCGQTEFRQVSASRLDARKGRVRTKGSSSSANMVYRIRMVNKSKGLFTRQDFLQYLEVVRIRIPGQVQGGIAFVRMRDSYMLVEHANNVVASRAGTVGIIQKVIA